MRFMLRFVSTLGDHYRNYKGMEKICFGNPLMVVTEVPSRTRAASVIS